MQIVAEKGRKGKERKEGRQQNGSEQKQTQSRITHHASRITVDNSVET
jgi:hypothetical protein